MGIIVKCYKDQLNKAREILSKNKLGNSGEKFEDGFIQIELVGSDEQISEFLKKYYDFRTGFVKI
ncbi:hypothetical protein KAT63_04740 [Candidatus Parcubacteria bacterium]|nr:hypothetical protein [Candidatus Parcubacteria bacterium]